MRDKSRGYAPPVGPENAPILFVGEALGEDEARQGEPFVGPAGGLLNRLLARSHQRRDQFRIDNLARCQPPGNWFDERAPYYWSASQHCKAVHLDQTLAEPHKVVVSLGGTPLKHLLGIHKGIRVQDFHGCVTPLPDGKWLVPTFHPSHLQRGAMNLFGAVSFDLQRALQVAEHGWHPTPVDVVVDPPVDWFTWWVEQVAAAVAQEPGSQRVWIAEDIETPDKASGRDEGELTSEDRSFQILRINFSVHPDEGVTVPYAGPYIALCQRLFALNTIHSLWNMEYDNPRLLAAGHTFSGERLDWMWAWHHLQSDVPRGLGFVAPFYSDFGAWKHLSEAQPGYYAGVDGFQTTRVSFGIAQDLEALGLWEVYWRHTHQVHKLALQPAQKVGVKIDRQRLDVFIESLEVKQRRLLHEMQGLVPDAWKPLTPKSGLKKAPADGVLHSKGTELKRDGQAKKEAPDPIKQELYAQTAVVVRRSVRTLATCCEACGAQEVAKTHRCAGTSGVNPARLVPRDLDLLRYFWQEPFNPDSPDQILDFIRHRGHKPGRAKKTGADSTDRETLSRLARETKDPLYQKILDTRAVGKVRGTYGVGTRKLLDAESRVHPVPTFKPSTHRLSYVSPNITNVVADKGGAETLAAGFRACVVASEQDPDWAPQQAPSVHRGTRLFECDFSGIEAVLTGWFQRDPAYMRLARLGVHAGLTSHVVGKPFNPSLPDAEIAAYFSALKAAEPIIYDRCKRNVHGKNYGLTIHGMVKNFPQTFPTLSAAKKISDIYDQMAPGLPVLHTDLRTVAYELNYLGGPSKPLHYPHHLGQIFARNPHLERHPFGYKHWFWSVLGFRGIPYSAYIKRQQQHEPVCIIQGKYFAITLGEDAKRVIAFFPQSTAAAVLKEVMLRLMDPEHPSYVGDAYYGQTPFRAPIHDSLFWEIPVRVWDRVVERIYREMLRPVPELPLDWVSVEDRARYGMGPLLSIGVEGKAGPNWKDMSKVKSPTLQELGLSGDDVVFPVEEADAEDLESLGTVA